MARKPARKITERMDDMMDRKAGIKDGSPRDRKLDAKRGLKPDKKRKGR